MPFSPILSPHALEGRDSRQGPGDSSEDVEIFARAIERAGLSAPAAIALHVARPLAWIGGQMMWAAQPFLEAMGIGARRGLLSAPRVAGLLENDEEVDRLVERLGGDAATRQGK